MILPVTPTAPARVPLQLVKLQARMLRFRIPPPKSPCANTAPAVVRTEPSVLLMLRKWNISILTSIAGGGGGGGSQECAGSGPRGGCITIPLTPMLPAQSMVAPGPRPFSERFLDMDVWHPKLPAPHTHTPTCAGGHTRDADRVPSLCLVYSDLNAVAWSCGCA